MAIEKILVVDDEPLMRQFLSETLSRLRFEVHSAENGKRAVAELKKNQFDLVVTDMKMPGLTGIDVLKETKKLQPNALVIIATAYGSIENVIEAMSLGAHNYILKPFSPDTIEAIINKAQEHNKLVTQNQFLKKELNITAPSRNRCRGEHQFIAKSASMQEILRDIKTVAQSQASVFIHGESGTGKEVIAQAIHHYSKRKDQTFVRVNCPAVAETLIESEFFGHEKGAFTGAEYKKLGRFEIADGGTLLLDEVTEIPLNLQPKLLRAIQEQEFERVGGTKPIKVDIRFIASSNRDMKQTIREKAFREDLYYRLNVVPIHIPPLRERKEDIIPLAHYYLTKLCQENHKKEKTLTKAAEEKLLNYEWPGNVRELINVIERAVVLDRSQTIDKQHLLLDHLGSRDEEFEDLKDLEKMHILKVLRQIGDEKKAAHILGVTLKTLEKKIREHQIDR